MNKTTLIGITLGALLVAGAASAQSNFTAAINGAQADAEAGTGSSATGTAVLTLLNF